MPSVRPSPAVALALAILLFGLAGCKAGQVGASTAEHAARDLVTQSQGSGTQILELTNQEPALVDSIWTVRVDATILVNPSTLQKALLHYVVEVPQSGGRATIVAKG